MIFLMTFSSFCSVGELAGMPFSRLVNPIGRACDDDDDDDAEARWITRVEL